MSIKLLIVKFEEILLIEMVITNFVRYVTSFVSLVTKFMTVFVTTIVTKINVNKTLN